MTSPAPDQSDWVLFLREETRPWWRRFGRPAYGPGPDHITTANPDGFQVGDAVEHLGRRFVIVGCARWHEQPG